VTVKPDPFLFSPRLETPRRGRVIVLCGWAMTGVAATLQLVFAALTGYWSAAVNMFSFGAGLAMVWLGAREIRRAAGHHQYMEAKRAEVRALRREIAESQARRSWRSN